MGGDDKISVENFPSRQGFPGFLGKTFLSAQGALARSDKGRRREETETTSNIFDAQLSIDRTDFPESVFRPTLEAVGVFIFCAELLAELWPGNKSGAVISEAPIRQPCVEV